MEPLLSLAFSMQSNKGVYTVLTIRSSMSHFIQASTVAEILFDQMRKLLRLQGRECEASQAELIWCRDVYEYSQI